MTRHIYLGLDGEGVQGHSAEEPNHKYVLLAAVTEDGKRKYSVENPKGLSTKECLRFLCNLPRTNTRLFGYALGYDWTKILTDIDDAKLYLLFRPDLRRRKRATKSRKGPRPIEWQGYSLNMQGTKFTVEHKGKKTVIWDIWKFYQSRFVGALKDWKVGNPDLYARMSAMKNRRATFQESEMPEIRAYCFEECQCMAALAHKLVDASQKAGLKLTSFYGAGSAATALLKVMGIQHKIRPPIEPMQWPVAQAFFGGRFEHNYIGEVNEPCFNYDISSAYPYQCVQLPCLIHGTWELSKRRSDLNGCVAALVHYGLEYGVPLADWAPFPYRDREGNICYPQESPGGWVWHKEYLAGERAFPERVRFKEAWIYKCDCDCKPFASLPNYYRERIKIGKEGPGIVYKLAMNSIYGKTAQSIGNGIFQCWMWAGMITSGCRAQALELFPLFKDRANVLMVATDGLLTKERIVTPKPLDTGTFECLKDGVPVPLGGWEEDARSMFKGCFLARPGIYFPLTPTGSDIKKVKGRGIGTGVVLQNHERIVESWRKHHGRVPVHVHGIERFCGAKTSVHHAPGKQVFSRAASGWESEKVDETTGVRLPPQRRAPAYGEWIVRTVSMDWNPMPKRAAILEDGSKRPYRKLALRSIPKEAPESMAYGRACLTFAPDTEIVEPAESVAMRRTMAMLEEQPDLDSLGGSP